MSALGGRPASAQSPNELLQPTRTTPLRVCRGPGPSQHTEPPLHSQGLPLGRWWARAPGTPGVGADLMVFRVAVVGPRGLAWTAQRASVPWPTWPPSLGTVPAHTGTQAISLGWGWGGGGGRISSIPWQPTLPRLAQHMWTCDTEREKAEGGKVLGSLVQEQ